MTSVHDTHFEMPPVPFLRHNRRLVQIVRQLKSVFSRQTGPCANGNEKRGRARERATSLPTLHLVF
jgi:hypothetical protein